MILLPGNHTSLKEDVSLNDLIPQLAMLNIDVQQWMNEDGTSYKCLDDAAIVGLVLKADAGDED